MVPQQPLDFTGTNTGDVTDALVTNHAEVQSVVIAPNTLVDIGNIILSRGQLPRLHD